MYIRSLQLNPILGDIRGNAQKLVNECQKALSDGINLVVTPECYLCGYPPEDLIFRPAFKEQINLTLEWLAKQLEKMDIAVILGSPRYANNKIYNSAFWIYKGEYSVFCDKKYLPDYGVFDDSRLFSVGSISNIITYKDIKIGIMICEDMWHIEPSRSLKEQGAELLISLNASPFEMNKIEKRLEVAKKCSEATALPLVTSFIIGGQDEIVFDGHSFALDAGGHKIAEAQGFIEDYYDVEFSRQSIFSVHSSQNDFDSDALLYNAITLGLRDYILKNNFKGIVLGLSGGIDSVLSAVIAVDAIGADKVHCLLMPSQYTSQESFNDAYALIDNLKITHDIIAIQECTDTVENALTPLFQDCPKDITEENIQSRMRGLILMAYSNKMGHMVLTTGNKSEMAVGYATLYGDMCGGYNALKDIYKTQIYALSHYRNQHKPLISIGSDQKMIIPQNVITKAPTAELRDNQKDSDSLPEYDLLDIILNLMIEKELGIVEIAQKGFDLELVKKIRSLVDRSEYKRRQSAPGPKVTSKNFGRDRRYPITNSFRA